MRLLLEQTVRMFAETRGLAALSAEVPWLTKLTWGLTENGDVKLDFDITLGTVVHEAVLVFPELFPHAPAYVRPRISSEAWSVHQYPATGTLCLEWGPDNWHAGESINAIGLRPDRSCDGGFMAAGKYCRDLLHGGRPRPLCFFATPDPKPSGTAWL
jgi:hypothetical protein